MLFGSPDPGVFYEYHLFSQQPIPETELGHDYVQYYVFAAYENPSTDLGIRMTVVGETPDGQCALLNYIGQVYPEMTPHASYPAAQQIALTFLQGIAAMPGGVTWLDAMYRGIIPEEYITHSEPNSQGEENHPDTMPPEFAWALTEMGYPIPDWYEISPINSR
jgi:hypothetical protein